MLIEKLKSKVKEAMKAGNTLERDVLKFVLSEVGTVANSANQAGKPVTDEQVQKIIKKTIETNVALATSNSSMPIPSPGLNEKLEAENQLLSVYVPKTLSLDEIRSRLEPIALELKSAPKEGPAIGMARKLLLQDPEVAVEGEDIKTVVQNIRSEGT